MQLSRGWKGGYAHGIRMVEDDREKFRQYIVSHVTYALDGLKLVGCAGTL